MKVHAFTVVPAIPEPLKRLPELANNLRWCWDPETLGLFQRLDPDLWSATYHNPVRILGEIKQERLNECLNDNGFMAHYQRVCESFDAYVQGPNWFTETYGGPEALRIAYFSAEFGINESVPIYSGGLGVLAGDHLKAASDLGLPLTGVSLLYRQGYFSQYLNADGWQQEDYSENDFYNLPVALMRDDQGNPLTIQVEYPGRIVKAQLWDMNVGRARLIFMDTNVPENAPEDQEITAQLYGGGHDMRIRQEILMGIGGVRALKVAGITPDIYHMNEGHFAFLAVERIRMLMEEHGVDFQTAREAVRASNVFTTHTPVAAGNDAFSAATIEYYFKDYSPKLSISIDEFLAMGRQDAHNKQEEFSLTILALNLASQRNGVSALHGDVSRRMWKNVWPGVLEHEVPIGSITNGVHTRGWISHEMGNLFDRYLGPQWAENPADESVWSRALDIPDSELWRTHERRRERLVAFTRRRLRRQLVRRGAPASEIQQAEDILDPEVLTIGFARRFALYKRGTLLLHDRDRLKRLLTDRDRPIQIIFAGKAHPADQMAKEIIRELVHFMRDPEVRRRVAFIENYDMNVARYLLQGVDVWLNTPRRPLEASGTSGMKAAANGALNLSILDGWWVEGYDPANGWAIGQGEEYQDLKLQDEVESRALYETLEKEIIPTFYDRTADDMPRRWISRMKVGVHKLCAGFSANRMLNDYIEGPYMKAASLGVRLMADGLAGARDLSEWKKKVRANWDNVRLESVSAPEGEEFLVGQEAPIGATVSLGELGHEDVLVQIYHGTLNSKDEIVSGQSSDLEYDRDESGKHVFKGTIRCTSSGRYGFALRILPRHESLSSPFDMKNVHWID